MPGSATKSLLQPSKDQSKQSSFREKLSVTAFNIIGHLAAIPAAMTQRAAVLNSAPNGLPALFSTFGIILSPNIITLLSVSMAWTMFTTNTRLVGAPASNILLTEVADIDPPTLPPLKEQRYTAWRGFFSYLGVAMVYFAAIGWAAVNVNDLLKNGRYITATMTAVSAATLSILFNKAPFMTFTSFLGSLLDDIPFVRDVGDYLGLLLASIKGLFMSLYSKVSPQLSTITSQISTIIKPVTVRISSLRTSLNNWIGTRTYGMKLIRFSLAVIGTYILSVGLHGAIFTASIAFFGPGGGYLVIFGPNMLSPTLLAWAPYFVTAGMDLGHAILDMKFFMASPDSPIQVMTLQEGNGPKTKFVSHFLQNASFTQTLIAAVGVALSLVGGGFGMYILAHETILGLGYSVWQLQLTAILSTLTFGAFFTKIVPVMTEIVNFSPKDYIEEFADWFIFGPQITKMKDLINRLSGRSFPQFVGPEGHSAGAEPADFGNKAPATIPMTLQNNAGSALASFHCVIQ